MLFGCTINMFLEALALVFMFFVWSRFQKNLSLIQVIHNQYDRTVVKLARRFKKWVFKHRKTAFELKILKT